MVPFGKHSTQDPSTFVSAGLHLLRLSVCDVLQLVVSGDLVCKAQVAQKPPTDGHVGMLAVVEHLACFPERCCTAHHKQQGVACCLKEVPACLVSGNVLLDLLYNAWMVRVL